MLVDKPGAPQTQLRVASIGVPRATPDYEAIRVMNEALGGLFSSRINLNLREQHGYTYGASSQFVFRRSAGPVLVAIGRAHRRRRRRRSRRSCKEVRGSGDDAVTAEELTLAKDSLVRSLPAEFETSGRVDGEHGEHLPLRSRPRLLREAPARAVGGRRPSRSKAAAREVPRCPTR